MTASSDYRVELIIDVITDIDGVLSKLHTLRLLADDKYKHVCAQSSQDIKVAQLALVRDLITTDEGGDEV